MGIISRRAESLYLRRLLRECMGSIFSGEAQVRTPSLEYLLSLPAKWCIDKPINLFH
ncbi:hypothetical protein OIDMADRAFT_18951 [Oidiodendron maius Zn]|uniref:Uncharacterized protein n=1 Tax=Oidiodendron maius (strain Zn) TaxID=913774 RepID=A0A0C3HGY8_OIDMZ|nr:hypothetical protein OIDMADRAFT_18951 [Oidiodendron maius Zn]